IGTAIEAAAIAEVPLKVAGEGPLDEELRRRAAELGAPVEFLGRVPGGEVRALLERAAALVVPSAGSEMAPFAPLEAMAAGVPVVATRSGGVPELVGEGRCVDRGDADGLADLLADLWLEPDLRRQEGEDAIERVRTRFGEERYLSELLALYRSLR
ncbi:MAG: glycosyltransferase, partial [Thermoleophilaceae bacterium]